MPELYDMPDRYSRISPAANPAVRETASVILFKPSGKYYTEESWRIPDGAITPADMRRSPDFRRIDGGAVLVDTQEPWGYPHLFPQDVAP